MAGVGQLIANFAFFVLEDDERRYAVRENGRQDRQIQINIEVCAGEYPEK